MPPLPVEHLPVCLLAGAAGDALGVPYEGRAAGTSGPVDPLAMPGPWRVSDDTVLSLATARALAAAGGRVDPAAIGAEYARVFLSSGVPGIGASTLRALTALARGEHWARAGATGERAAGNGAAMRIAPLAFVCDPFTAEGRRDVRDVARITHRDDEAYVGALALLLAMHRWEPGPGRGAALARAVAAELPDTRVRDALLDLGALAPGAAPAEAAALSGSSGFVAESVPLAIFVAGSFDDPGDALPAAVACGGDTDTVASMTGQVLGALGRAIPEAWRPPLAEVEAGITAALAPGFE